MTNHVCCTSCESRGWHEIKLQTLFPEKKNLFLNADLNTVSSCVEYLRGKGYVRPALFSFFLEKVADLYNCLQAENIIFQGKPAVTILQVN